MGAIIGAAIRVLLASSVAKWLAWKTVIAFVVTTIIGIVLYNLVAEIVGECLVWVADQVAEVTTTGWEGAALQFTGLGAWFADRLQIPEQVGVMVAFVSTKWLVVKVPFLKW